MSAQHMCDHYHTASILHALEACPEAIFWSEGHPEPRQAWLACCRGDWLLWIADRLGVDRKMVARAACACVRAAIADIPIRHVRLNRAIDGIERLIEDPTILETVRSIREHAQIEVRTAYMEYAYQAMRYVEKYITDRVSDPNLVSSVGRWAAISLAMPKVSYHQDDNWTPWQQDDRLAKIIRGIIPWSMVAKQVMKWRRNNVQRARHRRNSDMSGNISAIH